MFPFVSSDLWLNSNNGRSKARVNVCIQNQCFAIIKLDTQFRTAESDKQPPQNDFVEKSLQTKLKSFSKIAAESKTFEF